MKRVRVTRNYIKDWVNEKFKQLEILDFECYAVERTYFTQDQYESGACHLHINCKSISRDLRVTFLCFYSIWYLQKEVNNGYELYLKFDRLGLISNTTLELRAIQTLNIIK